jgi:DNA-binding PadR family transcriptional regulator
MTGSLLGHARVRRLTTVNSLIYIFAKIMPDRLRAAGPLLPLKPKVLHILLAVADAPRHGYSIMQEVLERTDGQVRLWPAALYGLLRELERTDLIVESDKRPSADEDDERRRYFALTPHGKRVLDAEVRRLEAIVHHARSSRALRKPHRA